MKEQIKYYFPSLWGIGRKVYRKFYYIWLRHIRPLLGTKLEEKYWIKKPPSNGIEVWNTKDHPHRNFLIEQISVLSPIRSILEIGCNSGPNLYLLAKKLPDAELRGIDINKHAVEYGNKKFKEEGIKNAILSIGKADVLDSFKDNSFDIVFTDAVLMFIAQDKIKKVLRELIRIGRKALVLMEWHCFELKSPHLSCYTTHWVRDYVALLKNLFPDIKVRFIKMPTELWPDKNWQRFGGIVIAEK